MQNHTISSLTQVLGHFAIMLIHRDSYRLKKKLRQIIFNCIVQRGLCVLYSGIPQECVSVLERCLTYKLIDSMPDQLTVNQYESGQGELLVSQ